MNHRQKLVQKQFLNNEEAIIRQLDQMYSESLDDINNKIKNLEFRIGKLQEKYDWMEPDDPEKEKVKSMIQSKIYQKNYQEQLQKQVGGILDQMKTSQYVNVSDYLDECYTDGFVGTIFDAFGQGVPFITPINQEAMVRAVQLDSKISQGLYTKLGQDVDLLKKRITAQVSRGIATGMTYAQVAQQLSNESRIGFNKSIRIARTEGHRIQTTATMDVMQSAKDKGADIVKQWDSTLDAKTRDSHAQVDGEVRELNKPFSNGLQYPGDPHGSAAEVVNCRCALLQRARWALEDEDKSFTKYNGFTEQIETFESPDDYNEFKKAFFSKENKNYMDYLNQMEERYGTKDFAKVLNKMTDREYNHYSELLTTNPIYNKKKLGWFDKFTNKSLTNSVKSDKVSLGKCQDFNGLGDYLLSKYGISIDDSVKSLDFQSCRTALSGIESIINEFPVLKGKIKRVTTGNKGFMSCDPDGIIKFNPSDFRDAQTVAESFKKFTSSGLWVKNSTPASVGVHEASHLLELVMIETSGKYPKHHQRVSAWNNCTEARAIVSQACKNIKNTEFGKGKKNAELLQTISGYAKNDPSEALADSFEDVFANGANASPLSKEIKKLTAEQLKKYSGGATS